jgi:DNA repair protein RadC
MVTERPRERCLKHGSEVLSLRECLALLFGTGPRGMGALGVAQELLDSSGLDLPSSDAERAFFLAMDRIKPGAPLPQVKGLGPAHLSKLLAAFELAKRYARLQLENQRRARSLGQGKPLSKQRIMEQALSRITPEWRNSTTEWIGFVPIYRSGGVGEFCLICRGSSQRLQFEPIELFLRLLPIRPAGFVLFHNHPSGDLRPSAEDQELTRQVRKLASSFEIALLAHWIIGSMGEELV